MIHPEETINRIKELLVISGVPEGEILDEMTDHYLCEVELRIERNHTHQKALRSTYQEIVDTDFEYLQVNKNKRHWPILLLFTLIISLPVLFYFYSNTHEEGSEFSIEVHHEAPNGWPINEPREAITSHYGWRKHPISRAMTLHKGIDIKATHGTLVMATGIGVVTEVGYSEKMGNYVEIKHNDRYSSRYHHLATVNVQEGANVSVNSKIGEVGNTGLSFGPHLHYEIMDRHVHIDPLQFIIP